MPNNDRMTPTLTKKIVAVVGSTGVQGGSIVRSLLNDGTFAVRAVTKAKRKVTKCFPRAITPDSALTLVTGLKAFGAEVVAADAEDVESLKKAVRGAWGVFGVTGGSIVNDTVVSRCTDRLIV